MLIDQSVYSSVSTPSFSHRWSFFLPVANLFSVGSLWSGSSTFCKDQLNFVVIGNVQFPGRTIIDNWIVQNHPNALLDIKSKPPACFLLPYRFAPLPGKRRAKLVNSLASQEPVNVISHYFPLQFHVKPSLLCNGPRIWKIATSKALLKAVAHAPFCYVKMGLNVLP